MKKNRFSLLPMLMGAFAHICFDAAAEGGSGASGGDDAAAKEAAALKAAEEATAKAKAEAEAAQAEADRTGDKNAVKLAEEKAELLREVMDKKAKLKEAQDDAASARAELAAYGGVDPQKVQALIQAEKDAEKAALEAKGEFESVKKMMADEHAKEMKAKDDEIALLKQQAASQSETIDKLTVGQSFATSKFIKDDLILSANKMRQLYGGHVGLQDGEVVVFDKPVGAAGRVAMVDGVGKPLSFDEGLKRLVDADPDKATMLKSKMSPGSKSKTTTPAGASKPKDNGLHGASRILASLNKEVDQK